MLRSFLAVGQGAFYCECFNSGKIDDNINIIYDCGSLTDIKIVEQAIRTNFQKGEIIHALFISHLDEDHINGIPFLLQYCKVKRIYFPLITEENRAIMRVRQLVNDTYGTNSFAFQFLENPREAIRDISFDDFPELIQISEAGQENIEQGISRENGDRNMRSGTNVLEEDMSGISGSGIFSKWLYIPFNFRQGERIQKLMDNLKIQFGKVITEKDLEQIWKANAPGDRDKIKEAYKTVPGSLNTNSMTLFSGEVDYGLRQFVNMDCRKYFYKCSGYFYKSSGCLYTGDYDAAGKMKWEQLKNAYRDYWKYIGCVQVPHHGSKHNFNHKFLDLDAFFVISAGYVNRYQHPHAGVIKSFLLRHICPYIVTEQAGSAVYFTVM